MAGMIHGQGGHNNQVNGQAEHGNPQVHGEAHNIGGRDQNNPQGEAAQRGRGAAGNEEFGVFTRTAKRIFIEDKVNQSLQRKFAEFKHLLIQNGHILQNHKVCINMKTRIVTVLQENGVKQHIDLSKFTTADNEDNRQMVALVQQIGNDLINYNVISKIESHQDVEQESRHLLGNTQGKNAFIGAIRGETKTRMTQRQSLIGFGSNSNSNNKTLIAANAKDPEISVKIAHAEKQARDLITGIEAQIRQLTEARVQDKQKIAKLQQEKELLGSYGLIEIICMLKARSELDIENGRSKEQMAPIYLKDIKAYFEDQRANGWMGTHTKGGLILTPSDNKLAALIVATACFVDGTNNHTNKHLYHDFMASNGYFGYENLGKLNHIFRGRPAD
jgi:hypothetical protein